MHRNSLQAYGYIVEQRQMCAWFVLRPCGQRIVESGLGNSNSSAASSTSHAEKRDDT